MKNDILNDTVEIQKRAASVGFDWPDISGVFEKVQEELEEVIAAWKTSNQVHAQQELGDLLFAVINLARFLDTDPVLQLDSTNKRFLKRFEYMSQIIHSKGLKIKDCSLDELDCFWEKAKKET
jgi:uncharacterized protein YabN with tetrapyrrole methylase and pyrophosphatase domain